MKHVRWIVGIIFLFTVSRIMSGNIVHAQTPLPQSHFPAVSTQPSPSTSTSGSTSSQCGLGAIPYCPTSGSMDMTKFLIPCSNPKGSTPSECSMMATSVTKSGESWYKVIPNEVYGMTGSNGQQYFIQATGDKRMMFIKGPNGLELAEDTSWSNEEVSTRCKDGSISFYRNTYTSGKAFLPYQMSCGSTYDSTFTMQAYHYTDETAKNPMSPAAVPCDTNTNVEGIDANGNHQVIGTNRQMIFSGQARCGDWSGNVIAILMSGGAGEGEIDFYGENKGLIAWYEAIDYASSPPSSWAGTDICAIQAICREKKVAEELEKGVANEDIKLSLTAVVADILADKLKIKLPFSSLEQTGNEVQPNLEEHFQTWGNNLLDKRSTYYHKTHRILDTEDKSVSFNSAVCIGGQKIAVSNEDIIQSQKSEMKDIIQDFRMFAASDSRGSEKANSSGQVDFRFKDQVLKKGSSPECGEQTNGNDMKERTEGFSGYNPYTGTTEGITGQITMFIPKAISAIGSVIDTALDILGIGDPVNIEGVIKSHTLVAGSKVTTQNVELLANANYPYALDKPWEKLSHGQKQNTYKTNDGKTYTTQKRFDNEDKQKKAVEETICTSVPRSLQNNPEFAFCKKVSDKPQEQNLNPSGSTGTNDISKLPGIDILAQCPINPSGLQDVIQLMPSYFQDDDAGALGAAHLQNSAIMGAFNQFSATLRRTQDPKTGTRVDPGTGELITFPSGEQMHINQAFLLALWIEESAASGYKSTSSQGMGCGVNDFFWMPAHSADNQKTVIDYLERQISCISSSTIGEIIKDFPESKNNPQELYRLFVCRWTGTGQYPLYDCDLSSVRSNAPSRLNDWYQMLTGNCGIIQPTTQ